MILCNNFTQIMCAVRAKQNLVGATSTDVFSEKIFRGPDVRKR